MNPTAQISHFIALYLVESNRVRDNELTPFVDFRCVEGYGSDVAGFEIVLRLRVVFGNAKIANLESHILIDEDVLRFQVSVSNFHTVHYRKVKRIIKGLTVFQPLKELHEQKFRMDATNHLILGWKFVLFIEVVPKGPAE